MRNNCENYILSKLSSKLNTLVWVFWIWKTAFLSLWFFKATLFFAICRWMLCSSRTYTSTARGYLEERIFFQQYHCAQFRCKIFEIMHNPTLSLDHKQQRFLDCHGLRRYYCDMIYTYLFCIFENSCLRINYVSQTTSDKFHNAHHVRRFSKTQKFQRKDK